MSPLYLLHRFLYNQRKNSFVEDLFSNSGGSLGREVAPRLGVREYFKGYNHGESYSHWVV